MSANLRSDARESTHDPLCPFAPWPDEHCYQKDAGMSMCALIAKVRADEREKAAERVRGADGTCFADYCTEAAATAARGDS